MGDAEASSGAIGVMIFAPTQSPQTLIMVRAMSSRRSTPMMTPIAETGI